MARRVFITVAERSADGHAANLVRALKTLDPTIEVHALGGDALRAAGADVHHDTVSNATMGLAAFKRAGEVRRLLKWTRAFYRATPPDLHVCCDSWTMNVHFARLARSFGVPVLYYIAPQAWASREGRVRELAKVADRLACILPFEEQFFRDRGVNATFVGHPLFDALPVGATPASPAPAERRPRSAGDAGVAPTTFPTIALPCGSRRGVARANFPRQLDVAQRIHDAFPAATFFVPTTPATHGVVMPLIRDVPYVCADLDGFDRIIRRADLAITVSGTATLHIAAHGVPMVVVYAGNRLLWHALGRWMIRIRTFAMVNLLANDGRDEPAKHVVPEFIPWYGPIDAVADRAIAMLRDPVLLDAQRAALRRVVATIGKPGASMNVARIALEMMAAATARAPRGTPGSRGVP